MWWKRIKAFFRSIRQLFFLFILSLVTFFAYLYFYGLPESWKDALLQELEERGVHLQIKALYFDPLKGLVARGVEFETGPANRVKMGELALHTSLPRMVRKRFTLENLEVEGSDIQIAFGKLQKTIPLRHAYGKFRLAGNGVVELNSLSGDFLGLHVDLHGKLDLSPVKKKPPTAQNPSPSPSGNNMKGLALWLDRMASMKVSHPIRVTARVEGKVADPNTLKINGDLQGIGVDLGSFHADLIQGNLSFENRVLQAFLHIQEMNWKGHRVREASGTVQMADGQITLPDLSIEQPSGGRLAGEFDYDVKLETLKFNFNSSLDIAEGMDLLYPSEKNWFRTVRYAKPPLLSLEGQWRIRDPEGLEAKGTLDWQDWLAGGVPIRSTKAQVEIMGRKFQFRNLNLRRDEGEVAGEFLMDFDEQCAHLNATSSISFSELTRIIGPATERTFSPYHFLTPPRIQFQGKVHFGTEPTDDLWTHVECDQFQVWKFKASKVSADVRSYRNCLEIAHYQSDFYDGKLQGDAIFDFSTPNGDWAFHTQVDQANFDQMTHDLWDYSQVEGKITGWADINGILPNSSGLKGHGEIKIADGVLWKIPLFGELSKFIPIVGMPKAKKGTAKFEINDEKVHIYDTDVNAGLLSLTAKGDYKFDQSLDFIVQVHLLRWLFGVGYVLDPFTKAFEFHLGGTLTHRKWRPRFVPKEMLFQFGDNDKTNKIKPE